MEMLRHDKADLHMHSTVSDGTDTPTLILDKVIETGITIFSLTDHDATKGCRMIQEALPGRDIRFIPGVEFSCRDDEGKYHILGYNYDPDSETIIKLVEKGHSIRVAKLRARLDMLKEQYGFDFPPEEVEALMALDNPGKPHIGNLMVKYGYAETMRQAMKDYLNGLRVNKGWVTPEEAIQTILDSGGIPVLAHPPYGSGNELIIGAELEERVKKLMDLGIAGLETFYSGFSKALEKEVRHLAEKYDLYITLGSDYHGSNKLVELGDTGFDPADGVPKGLSRFLAKCFGSGMK